jgi:hypothetical protein
MINTQPVKDLFFMMAYTHTEMKELSGMPGSNAGSAWSGLFSVNGPNALDLQRSQYVIPDKIIASASYKLPHWNNLLQMPTTISLFYVGQTSAKGQFSYSTDMNGDGLTTDLIYIPKAKGEIKFVSQADEDAFFAFMEQDKYLSKHKGEYAEAYSTTAPVSSFRFAYSTRFLCKDW